MTSVAPERPVRVVRRELHATTKAKEGAVHASDFARAAELRDKERELQREWLQFSLDEIGDALDAARSMRKMGPCRACGDRCPSVAKIRRLTTPMGVVMDDPSATGLLPSDPRRTGFVYPTHFYICLVLDEPVLLGICVTPKKEPEWTVSISSSKAATGEYRIAVHDPPMVRLPWWRRLVRTLTLQRLSSEPE